jgi:hypothetical protein
MYYAIKNPLNNFELIHLLVQNVTELQPKCTRQNQALCSRALNLQKLIKFNLYI